MKHVMGLQALLVSHDQAVLQTVRRVLISLGMAVEVCEGAERAEELLEKRKFDAAVLDIDGVPGAAAVLNEMRQSPSNRGTVAFAILGGVTTPQQAFGMGANLSLEKPLSMDRATRSFRAAHVLVAKERRQYYRHEVHVPVTVMHDSKETKAEATDLGEGGMALRTPKPLTPAASLELRFKLPDSRNWVTTRASVAWADAEGRAGVKFDNLPASSREELDRWIAERSSLEEPVEGLAVRQ